MGVMSEPIFSESGRRFCDQPWFTETLGESIMPYLDEARWLLVAT